MNYTNIFLIRHQQHLRLLFSNNGVNLLIMLFLTFFILLMNFTLISYIKTNIICWQRLLACDLPVGQDCFDIRIDRILTRTTSKKKWLHPELSEKYKTICRDVAFDYIDPEKSPEYSITLRVLRFQISDNNYENIITNLPFEEFSADELKHLYHLRWSIETSFRELKHVIGDSNFHSKKREFIEMEI